MQRSGGCAHPAGTWVRPPHLRCYHRCRVYLLPCPSMQLQLSIVIQTCFLFAFLCYQGEQTNTCQQTQGHVAVSLSLLCVCSCARYLWPCLGWTRLCRCVLSCWGVTVLLIAKGKHLAVPGCGRALSSLELSIEKHVVLGQMLQNNSVLMIIHLPTELLEVWVAVPSAAAQDCFVQLQHLGEPIYGWNDRDAIELSPLLLSSYNQECREDFLTWQNEN